MSGDKIARRLAKTDAAQLTGLARLAALKRDRQMRDVVKLAQARAKTLRQLERLSPATPLAPDAPELWQVTLQHNQWNENARRSLNLNLAQQTGAWLQARDAAARAVGQAEVLHRLSTHRRDDAGR
ncbi:hypothetical protein [Roseicitreum antarcticum]|uniref:Uncharacterized protein n=1 Tax=Roseicitreum antarcticum TaxID=564137 RepID=A0A1H2UR09_9RHOB|nr:hypothetical protein [Roseicitreum antarcticum]SDW58388.1 hypothetical protein SAMN04488238_102464 [Roseicitreum antarcticum]